MNYVNQKQNILCSFQFVFVFVVILCYFGDVMSVYMMGFCIGGQCPYPSVYLHMNIKSISVVKELKN